MLWTRYLLLVQVYQIGIWRPIIAVGCGYSYPPTRHVPPKLSVLIQYLADKLAAEPTLFKLKNIKSKN